MFLWVLMKMFVAFLLAVLFFAFAFWKSQKVFLLERFFWSRKIFLFHE